MSYQLMIHGGAGNVPHKEDYHSHLDSILQQGQKALENGEQALDVVELCVRLLEDDPVFNAGRGSVLTYNGEIEMDASIMDGRDMSAGAIAGVTHLPHPITLARYVRDYSDHVFLIGQGAMEFAQMHTFTQEPQEYFMTEKRYKQWQEAQEKERVQLDHSSEEHKLGTVGAVARDQEGNLAAATSTGGVTNKRFGRVGDTPLIGSGTFAENATCAVSNTGYGEDFIRTTLARTVSEYIRYRGMSAQEAAQAAIDYLVETVNGQGGTIVIDHYGNIGSAHSTPHLIHGYATSENREVLT